MGLADAGDVGDGVEANGLGLLVAGVADLNYLGALVDEVGCYLSVLLHSRHGWKAIHQIAVVKIKDVASNILHHVSNCQHSTHPHVQHLPG